MDDSEPSDAGAVETLDGTNPEFNIRVDRVLYQNWYVDTLERVSYLLDSKRIGTGTCSDPEDVDACLQCLFDMLRSGYFGCREHASLCLYPLEPRKSLLAVALETARFGAWLPDSGTEDSDSLSG